MFRVILIFLLTCSCARVAQNKMKEDITKRLFELFETTTAEISDGQIASIADRKASLAQNFNLAVYFKKPVQDENWRWTEEDRDMILSALRGQKDKVGKTFELINTGGKDEDLKSLRMMAAQQGADALLVVQGAAEVKSQANATAITYVALVPMLFANGNTVKSAFVTQAVLWDVRTSNVHLGAKSEGDWSMKRPLAFKQKDRAVRKAKEEALDDLREELKAEMNSLKVSQKT